MRVTIFTTFLNAFKPFDIATDIPVLVKSGLAYFVGDYCSSHLDKSWYLDEILFRGDLRKRRIAE
jgi:hypothetical protein